MLLIDMFVNEGTSLVGVSWLRKVLRLCMDIQVYFAEVILVRNTKVCEANVIRREVRHKVLCTVGLHQL